MENKDENENDANRVGATPSDIPVSNSDSISRIQDGKEEPYIFQDKPPVKSSTNVAVSAGGTRNCPGCGCRGKAREGCGCICHRK